MSQIILASQSSIRAQILRQAGFSFATRSSHVDEQTVKERLLRRGATPFDVAAELADAKAKTVSCEHAGWVIGADQTLEFQGLLLDKVTDLTKARERLLILRGKEHSLHSAVSIANSGIIRWRFNDGARLKMREFSDDFLNQYILNVGDKILSSVGCYQLEHQGIQLFEYFEGNYFSILGLPLLQIIAFFRSVGVLSK